MAHIENDLTDKLLNSSAINSLKLETEVYHRLKKLGWQVLHSPYYVDAETSKYREIDLIATRSWRCSTKSDLSCSVNLLIECKSIKDYHIVASNALDFDYELNYITVWIGNEYYNFFKKVKQILYKLKFTNDEVDKIISLLKECYYPEGTSVFTKLYLKNFKIPMFNAFRETNTVNNKDFDNSVVWKAYQSLNSCIAYYQDSLWQQVEFVLSFFPRDKSLEPKERILKAFSFLQDLSNNLKSIHPILIVESNLWEVKNEKLIKHKYIRLTFQRIFEDASWIDIVHKDFISEYFKKIKFYDIHFNQLGFT